MKNIIIILVLSSLSVSTFFAQRIFPIEKGIIKDNFAINFPEQNITIEPNTFFTLNALKLNITPRVGNYGNIYDADRLLKMYKRKDVISYKILIKNPTDNKVYYGRIAFFSVTKKHMNDAVASYFKIAIPEKYFEEARDGMKSCVYEFYKHKSTYNFLTWCIWLSDIPLD